jgi:hypothetical protein
MDVVGALVVGAGTQRGHDGALAAMLMGVLTWPQRYWPVPKRVAGARPIAFLGCQLPVFRSRRYHRIRRRDRKRNAAPDGNAPSTPIESY